MGFRGAKSVIYVICLFKTLYRLRNGSVLIVGMSGLGAEVAKNLMLCGLKALTIMDNKIVIFYFKHLII